jgi:ABC-type glutathione transport system ATPase component
LRSTPDPLLRVEHLRTVFPLAPDRSSPPAPAEGAAVDDVSFDVGRGETLGLVGESGSGKSVTALSIIRLVLPPGRITRGRIELDGRNLLDLDEAEMRQVRGRRIGFIFQEPMVALDPVYTIGYQVAETLAAHDLARGTAANNRAVELLDAVRIPDPARRPRLSPPALRRPAPAGDDRAGAVRRAVAGHRRRADDGARRHGAGRDPRPAPRHAPIVQPLAPAHHP